MKNKNIIYFNFIIKIGCTYIFLFLIYYIDLTIILYLFNENKVITSRNRYFVDKYLSKKTVVFEPIQIDFSRPSAWSALTRSVLCTHLAFSPKRKPTQALCRF